MQYNMVDDAVLLYTTGLGNSSALCLYEFTSEHFWPAYKNKKVQ